MKTKIILASLLLIPSLLFGAGESGALFLLSDPGARTASLAGAFTAKTEGVSGAFYNPASLGSVKKFESFFTYSGSIAGINSGHISAAFPLKDAGSVSVSGGYMTAGEIDNALEGEPVVKTGDAVAALSYGIKLGALSLGAAAKIFSSTMGEQSAAAFCADIGAVYAVTSSFSAGLAVRNAGPDFTYVEAGTSFPMTAALGLNFSVLEEKEHKLAVSGEVSYLVPDASLRAAAGVEYIFNSMLSARAGYGYEKEAVTGFTAGAGIKIGAGEFDIIIDYAFVPAFWDSGVFEASNLVTLGVSY